MRLLERIAHTMRKFPENAGSAFDSLASAKGRSGLTILGVVIGVSTVMAMATIVAGIRDQIVATIEIAGPTTFYVMKVWSQTPLNPEDLPKWVRVRPDLTMIEATTIAKLPEIKFASIWGLVQNRVEYGGTGTNGGGIIGGDAGYPEIYGGQLAEGRWFTRSEELSGAAVVVLDANVAHRLFGAIQPIDKWVRVGTRPM